MYTSEIEKLERRWNENPKGRNFAPLADAYRKAGELDRALELCKNGLEMHPDYVSAHIVYGRCLIDQKKDADAEGVFRGVLGLDPENILALKVLAEIAERGGRHDQTVEWLTRLLAADPMNGDAAEALTRAKVKAAASPAARPPSAVTEATTAALPKPDFVIEHASDEAPAPLIETAKGGADIETFDGTLDFDSVAHQAAKAEGLEVQEDVVLKPQPLEVEGLARTQYESGQFAPPPIEDELPHVDLPLIMPEDVTPPVHPPVPPAPAPAKPAAVALSDDDGAADAAALSRAEPVLTETMAELYLRQGHVEDAVRVYQALVAQRPGDGRLRAKLEALTGGRRGGGGGASARQFLQQLFGPKGAAVPEPPSPGVASPLEQAFAEAPGEPEPGAPGAATRPAEDNISLDAIFGGEEGARPPNPTPPQGGAGGAGGGGGAPPQASQTGGFSFDQFFGAGSPPAGEAGAGGAPPPKAGGRASGPKARPPVESEGELDQFQSWLKGLKS